MKTNILLPSWLINKHVRISLIVSAVAVGSTIVVNFARIENDKKYIVGLLNYPGNFIKDSFYSIKSGSWFQLPQSFSLKESMSSVFKSVREIQFKKHFHDLWSQVKIHGTNWKTTAKNGIKDFYQYIKTIDYKEYKTDAVVYYKETVKPWIKSFPKEIKKYYKSTKDYMKKNIDVPAKKYVSFYKWADENRRTLKQTFTKWRKKSAELGRYWTKAKTFFNGEGKQMANGAYGWIKDNYQTWPMEIQGKFKKIIDGSKTDGGNVVDSTKDYLVDSVKQLIDSWPSVKEALPILMDWEKVKTLATFMWNNPEIMKEMNKVKDVMGNDATQDMMKNIDEATRKAMFKKFFEDPQGTMDKIRSIVKINQQFCADGNENSISCISFKNIMKPGNLKFKEILEGGSTSDSLLSEIDKKQFMIAINPADQAVMISEKIQKAMSKENNKDSTTKQLAAATGAVASQAIDSALAIIPGVLDWFGFNSSYKASTTSSTNTN